MNKPLSPMEALLAAELSAGEGWWRFEPKWDGFNGHGTKLLRWRPDKAPKACTFDQLAPELRPSDLEEMFGS